MFFQVILDNTVSVHEADDATEAIRLAREGVGHCSRQECCEITEDAFYAAMEPKIEPAVEGEIVEGGDAE
jgi:hypothetical protein